MNIDITGLDKADVLTTLYNYAVSQGIGRLLYTPEKMTTAEARHILDEGKTYFDYVHGRVMKITLDGDTLDSHLYDRDNGEGAALYALTKQGLLTP